MAKVGRKRSFTGDEYFEAVKKIRDIDDKLLSKELKCSQRSVSRFRINPDNKEIIDKAIEFINTLSQDEYTRDLDNWTVFFNLPIIQKWDHILRGIRVVSPKKTLQYERGFWHVCKHLRKHPNNITENDCAELVIKMRQLYLVGEKQPRGLAYSIIREAIRSFFTLMRKLSGEYLSSLGITKEALKDTGKYAKQRIPKDIRHKFEETLKEVCIVKLTDEKYKGKIIDIYLELLNLAKWLYYTGTRISASLEFSFRTNKFTLRKNVWKLIVIDKGEHKKGRKKWDKYLVGFALQDFKKYLSDKFHIPIENIEHELPRKIDFLFPNFIDTIKGTKDTLIRDIYRDALIKAGLSYTDFQPIHIWRHTFAQDFLDASDQNYELCASLGGWDSTDTLKRYYGEMGEKPKVRGLRKTMGLKVEEEIHELRW